MNDKPVTRDLLKIFIFSLTALLLINSCSGGSQTSTGGSANVPSFMNGIDENSYLALWTGKVYTEGTSTIPSANLPYKYFGSKGVNYARIRVWPGSATDGNYSNALANGLAAKQAGLNTLLVIFLSEQWPDNVGCDNSKVASIFRTLSFVNKKAAIKDYVNQLVKDFNSDGLFFDLYAVDNEIYNCVCGETDKGNMADILNTAYDAIRAVDPMARFVFHIPHVPSSDALNYFNNMLNVNKVKCDYISMSFYPLQYGSTAFEDYKKLVSDLYAAHHKPFIISEWAYSDNPLPSNSFWIQQGIMHNIPLAGYDQTPQGQADLVEDLLVWAKGSGKVAGVFYWSPLFNEENESGGVLYGWTWLSLFNTTGSSKQAISSLAYGSSQ